MRSFLAAMMLCVLAVTTAAEARPRHKAKSPSLDRQVVALLKKQAAEQADYRRKQDAASAAMLQEIAELRSMLRTKMASIAPEGITPEAPLNPVAVAPMPIPDPSTTLKAYRDKVEIDSIGKIPPKGLGNIKGLKPHFVAKLAAMRKDMPAGTGFAVGSGYRTRAQQAALHRQKPRLAAPPGRSNHEKGLAGDLRFASRESSRWVHRNAPRYGLRFPMSYEPWHIEPVGLTRTRYASKRHRVASAR